MRTRRDWAVLLAELARSELTQADFCAQHGIYPANLRRARLRLEAQAALPPQAGMPASSEPFVQVVPPTPSAPLAVAPPLELAFGALTLRFAPSTAPRVVAALVKALA